MVVLGFYAPNSNIAHTATAPGLQLLAKAFQAADEQLSAPGMTWNTFFETLPGPNRNSSLLFGAAEFISSQNSFAKVDIQFWGRTLAKGKGLVGWVESRCISLVVGKYKYPLSCPHMLTN
jgi:hypothetical protein